VSLSILIWLPLAVGILQGLAPAGLRGRVALLGAVATMGVAIGAVAGFDTGKAGLQFATDEMWISQLGIHYKLGMDGLNVVLVLLTTVIWAAATFAGNLRTWDRPGLFWFNMALAETAVLGAFLAQDLALFVVFFDLMLVPFYFLIGIWGVGPNRVAATTKLVIYTLVGSLLMLAAAVATGVLAEQQGQLSYAFSDLAGALPAGSQKWIFWCFALAFLVKMPAFPLHGWMPDGYRAMPIPVLAVFSAILSKVAAYGFLRVTLPLFPEATADYQTVMLILALASILYGSVMAFSVTNARLILGYSSVAQLGFIVLGIFSLSPDGIQGSILQAVNHGLVVAPMIFIVAMLAQRAAGSEDIRDMGGIAKHAPVFAALFLICTLATLAMPGSSNFVGEFLILLGAFQHEVAVALIAGLGVALAAVYALRFFIRAMHNRVGPDVVSVDLGAGERLLLGALVAAIVALAVYPNFALERSQPTVRPAQAQATAGTPAGWTAYAPLRETAEARR
jgi:NADH-quinone oxidoreductase subunit M